MLWAGSFSLRRVSQEDGGFCLPGRLAQWRLLEKVPEKALGTPREQPPCDGAPSSEAQSMPFPPVDSLPRSGRWGVVYVGQSFSGA